MKGFFLASSCLASPNLCYSQQRLPLFICLFPDRWTDWGFGGEQSSPAAREGETMGL